MGRTWQERDADEGDEEREVFFSLFPRVSRPLQHRLQHLRSGISFKFEGSGFKFESLDMRVL